MTLLQQTYNEARTRWRELQDSEVPVFFVGAATCGRAAGATEVLQRLRDHIKAKNINASVVEVGCLGPCSFEPLVIVQKKNSPRVCFGNVGPDE
ncbi:MAG TPA: NADH-quinone oxidoreductase subunit F, partial [Phycisphaerales bacterium]|nr:NADH-quinone oxidoreductase subunit F [Phycisphaerales bacterium]